MTDRSIARATGLLFVVASVAAIAGGVLLLPAVDSNYLVEASASSGAVITGALLELVLALSVVGIASVIFPVLKRSSESLALTLVGVRIIEGVLILAGTLASLLVLSLSRDFGGLETSGVEPLGETLIALREWSYWLGPMLSFSVSAVIFNYLLFRAKLVPVWLSIWGLIGGLLLIARTLLEMFGTEVGVALGAIVTAPIGLNEMVLAVLLIVRGFRVESPGVSY